MFPTQRTPSLPVLPRSYAVPPDVLRYFCKIDLHLEHIPGVFVKIRECLGRVLKIIGIRDDLFQIHPSVPDQSDQLLEIRFQGVPAAKDVELLFLNQSEIEIQFFFPTPIRTTFPP